MEAGQAQLLASRQDVPVTYDIVAVEPLSERVMQQVGENCPETTQCLLFWLTPLHQGDVLGGFERPAPLRSLLPWKQEV